MIPGEFPPIGTRMTWRYVYNTDKGEGAVSRHTKARFYVKPDGVEWEIAVRASDWLMIGEMGHSLKVSK